MKNYRFKSTLISVAHILQIIGVFIYFVGAIFRIQHWPNGILMHRIGAYSVVFTMLFLFANVSTVKSAARPLKVSYILALILPVCISFLVAENLFLKLVLPSVVLIVSNVICMAALKPKLFRPNSKI